MGGLLVLKAMQRLFAFIKGIFADEGYQGEAVAVQAPRSLATQIVKRWIVNRHWIGALTHI